MIWEGAYRLYLGEIPFRDFGIPMGVCSWIIPAFFFKLFGPTLFTLAKAQAFLNIVSGLSFRWILLRLGASFQTRFLSTVIYSLTYILGLYWPQYNHTVIIFQIVAFAFLFQYINGSSTKYSWLYLMFSCFFLSVSFFTKQDAGGLSILIGIGIISIHCYTLTNYKPLFITFLFLTAFFSLAIIPFLQYDFSYWFNYGQAPHNSRVSIYDIVSINMEESRWEKFYLIVILGVTWIRYKQKQIKKLDILFTLFVVGLLLEAMIFQVTSYVPRDNNIFFHAFACSYLLYYLYEIPVFRTRSTFLITFILLTVWLSGTYWRYADGIFSKAKKTNTSEISINTYILEPEACNYYTDLSTWRNSPLKSFAHVKMPASAIDGMNRFLKNVRSSETKPLILNMSELTPLAHEVPFELENGPLWFHLGVGMFDREVNFFADRIESDYYDFVIFENLPYLNNFYPFCIREKLQQHYQLIDSFEAPRIVYPGTIEVYSRRVKSF